jgi:hypothetical protein
MPMVTAAPNDRRNTSMESSRAASIPVRAAAPALGRRASESGRAADDCARGGGIVDGFLANDGAWRGESGEGSESGRAAER